MWSEIGLHAGRLKREFAVIWLVCHSESEWVFEQYGIDRSHVAIYNWVHKADLQPISTVSEDQLAVDENMIRLHGQKFWLYSMVDPQTNEILHVSLYPTTNE